MNAYSSSNSEVDGRAIDVADHLGQREQPVDVRHQPGVVLLAGGAQGEQRRIHAGQDATFGAAAAGRAGAATRRSTFGTPGEPPWGAASPVMVRGSARPAAVVVRTRVATA